MATTGKGTSSGLLRGVVAGARASWAWVAVHWKFLLVLTAIVLAAGKLREWELGMKSGPLITIAPNGVVQTVNEAGQSVSRHRTYKGLNHGPFEQVWPNGVTSCLGFYSVGEQVGKWHWFDETGQLIKFKDFGNE